MNSVLQAGQTRFELSAAPWRRYITAEEPLTVNQDDRTVKLSISSATPLDRGWFIEQLEHRSECVNLDRAKSGCQALFNHNSNDYVGVVEDAWLDPGLERCFAIVRFDTHPLAEQVYQSIQSGILRNVSIGYQVKEWRQETDNRSDVPTLRVTDWELLEVSFVTVPADPSVGVGRSLGSCDPPERSETEAMPEERSDDEPDTEAEPMGEDEGEGQEIELTIELERTMEVQKTQNELLEAERERTNALLALGEKHSLKRELVQGWIQNGVDLQSARSQVLDLIQGTKTETVAPLNPLGLDERERNNYSIAKALLNQVLVREGKNPVPGLELEVHKTIEAKLGRPTEGFYVPARDLNWNLLESRALRGQQSYYGQREPLQTASPTLGGNLVATELRSGEFIEALRNRAMVSRLGARMLSGLEGNVDIPRQSGVSSTYWISEGATITESNLTIDLVQLRPKDLTALSSVTRRMLLQGSLDIEALIRFDMLQQMALGIDLAAISGTGTNNQPTGILNTAGVNSVAIGANGGAPTWNHLVQLETEIAVDNADTGTCYYLTNARTRGKLKTTAKVTGQDVFLWQDSTIERGMGMVNGYSAATSNQVPSNLTKGSGTNLSAIIFGDFSQLMIGEWGVLEIMPNPYGAGYPSGTIQVRSMVTLDIVPRRPEYFAVCTDVVTT